MNELPKRKPNRLQNYDYSQNGAYFVTICVKNRECLFGEICNGEMILNEYGNIVKTEIINTQNIRSNVEIPVFVVMPNHIHCIIVIVGAYCIRPNELRPNELRPNNSIDIDNPTADEMADETAVTVPDNWCGCSRNQRHSIEADRVFALATLFSRPHYPQ